MKCERGFTTMPIALYTRLHAKCKKQALVIIDCCQLPSVVNNRPTRSLVYVTLQRWMHCREIFISPEFEEKSQREVLPYFWIYPNFLITQYSIGQGVLDNSLWKSSPIYSSGPSVRWSVQALQPEACSSYCSIPLMYKTLVCKNNVCCRLIYAAASCVHSL